MTLTSRCCAMLRVGAELGGPRWTHRLGGRRGHRHASSGHRLVRGLRAGRPHRGHGQPLDRRQPSVPPVPVLPDRLVGRLRLQTTRRPDGLRNESRWDAQAGGAPTGRPAGLQPGSCVRSTCGPPSSARRSIALRSPHGPAQPPALRTSRAALGVPAGRDWPEESLRDAPSVFGPGPDGLASSATRRGGAAAGPTSSPWASAASRSPIQAALRGSDVALRGTRSGPSAGAPTSSCGWSLDAPDALAQSTATPASTSPPISTAPAPTTPLRRGRAAAALRAGRLLGRARLHDRPHHATPTATFARRASLQRQGRLRGGLGIAHRHSMCSSAGGPRGRLPVVTHASAPMAATT